MLIRILSDIHLEFGDRYLIPQQYGNEYETYLILAGDIGHWGPDYRSYITRVAERYKRVIVVAGNHEYYRGNYSQIKVEMDKWFWTLPNCNLLENDIALINGATIYGTTLWTNYNNTPLDMLTAKNMMNDFRLISHDDGHPITPEFFVECFNNSKEWLETLLQEHDRKMDGKCIVVTHHAPSFCSISEKYRGHVLNSAFASNLDNLILDTQPDLWIHGHVHDHFDYMIGKTRIICNSAGYPREPTNFIDDFVIEL